ncbi:MAG TPA: DUF1080 domain-containing protein [Verrucomicrobiae bacterium]
MARDIVDFTKPSCIALTLLLAGFGVLSMRQASAQTQTVATVAVATNQAKVKESAPVEQTAEAADEVKEKAEDDDKVVKLLGKEGLDTFYTWIAGAGVFVDPKGVFSIEEGVLRVSGERLGYLATRKEYSDFRLVAEYKWGELKSGNRTEKPRSSGLFVHGVGEDKEWMRGFECQIAEGRTGNVVIHSGAKFTIGTNTHTRAWTEIGKPVQELEAKHGEWNKIEILSAGDKLRVLINGQQSVEATQLLPNRGKILLQSNGAEIFFRKLELHPLAKMPEAAVQTAAK